MSGIPVYTSSPLHTAYKASGATPQTSTSNSHPEVSPTASETTRIALYMPAHPGSAPFSAPARSSQRYAPTQPTPTAKTDSDRPPPPQPGAFPIPLSTGIPPPPKVGERYQPPHSPHAQSMPQPYPPQMFIPPPNTAFGLQPPASSTAATTTATSKFPVSIPAAEFGAPRRSIEHSPGYHQNNCASEFTSDQRGRAQDANNLTGLGSTSDNESTESAWTNTAKKWASAAGDKLSETEAEIWRRINKE